ncbi:MAG: T9SS type A sorting domain-containing protein, partial [Bacteroidota bacterium]
TIAHELKHAIQYATNCFSGNEININWVEMDATLMENVVYPNVNDYYNYIGGTAGIFGNPQTRFPRAYSHVTFMLYYQEDFGKDFWVDVWEEIGAEYLAGRNIPMLEAMDRVIGERRSGENAELPDLEQSLLRNYLWHLASGERSLFAYGFSERLNYPDAQVAGSYDVIPEWPGDQLTVPYHSARFFEFRADQMDAAGEVAIALFNSDLPLGIGLLGKTYNGNVVEYLVHPGEEKRQKKAFSVDWKDLDWLGVVAMNTLGGSPVNRLQLLAGEGPSIERYHYGNISRSGNLSISDAEWILSQTLNPVPLSAFDIFLGDVSGDGTVSPYDAARVLKNLDTDTGFPIDDNEDGRGPEWSRFTVMDPDDDPPASVSAASLASPSAKKSATVIVSAAKQDFKPVFVPATEQRTEVGSDPSTAPDTLFDGPDDLPDTLLVSLHLLEDQVLAEQKMELLLEIQDGSEGAAQPDVPWHALYLDLEIDFPPEDGGTQPGDPISLEMVDLLPGNGESALRVWDSDNTSQRLRLALASSAPLVSEEDPSRLSILQLIPQNEGLIHFRVAGLQLDEYDYAVAHTPMDTIRVMGPVFADEPDEPDPEIPGQMVLKQNYPNPFNPETVIAFSLPEAGQVSLHIYDITGRRVATLVNGHIERGRHRIRFDMRSQADLSSGVYLYRLSSNGQALTRKMTLVK